MVFGLYLFMKIVWAYGVGPMWNLVDAVATKRCEAAGVDWSWSYTPGNIGLMVGPVITGALLNVVKFSADKVDCLSQQVIDKDDYSFPFFCCSGAIIISSVMVFFFDIDIKPEKNNIPWRKEMAWILTTPVLFFYAILFIFGVNMGATEGFHALYIIEELNVSASWYAYLTSIFMGVSLAYCLIAGTVKKFVGDMNLLLICAIVSTMKMTITLFLSAYEDDATPVALIFINACGLGLPMWVGVVSYNAKVSPPHLRGTSLGLCASMNWVLGRGLGSLSSGAVNALVGRRQTMAIYGFTCMILLIILGFVYHIYVKHQLAKLDYSNNPDEKVNNVELKEKESSA